MKSISCKTRVCKVNAIAIIPGIIQPGSALHPRKREQLKESWDSLGKIRQRLNRLTKDQIDIVNKAESALFRVSKFYEDVSAFGGGSSGLIELPTTVTRQKRDVLRANSSSLDGTTRLFKRQTKE